MLINSFPSISGTALLPPVDDGRLSLRYLRSVGLAMYSLQPISVPGFAFCWLEMVAHRSFMPKMLAPGNGQGSALYEVCGHG